MSLALEPGGFQVGWCLMDLFSLFALCVTQGCSDKPNGPETDVETEMAMQI